MNLPPGAPNEVAVFGLIFIRVSTFLFLLPFYGSANIPTMVKAFFAVVITVALYGAIRVDPAAFPSSPLGLMLMLLAEILAGAAIALFVRMFFAAVQLAGQVIGFQMGLAIVNVIDPGSGTQASIVAQLGYICALLVFLSVDGHHALLRGLVHSFDLMPLGGFELSQNLWRQMLHMSNEMFIVGIKIGAPAIAALLLAQVAMGVVAKTVPQMNILVVGFPITIGLGLIMFGLVVVLISQFTIRYFADLEKYLGILLRSM